MRRLVFGCVTSSANYNWLLLWVIGYADDLALLGQSTQEVVNAVTALTAEACRVGLRVNQEKTEYLHMKRYKNTWLKREDLRDRDFPFKGFASFKYLGW